MQQLLIELNKFRMHITKHFNIDDSNCGQKRMSNCIKTNKMIRLQLSGNLRTLVNKRKGSKIKPHPPDAAI